SWDFGDSGTGHDFEDVHIYDASGEYTIVLTARDILTGCSASSSKKITVHKAPLAAFRIPENDGCQPLHITFLNETEGGDYYAWDFGNGNRSVDVDGQQVFSQPGSFVVKLRASNVEGCTDTAIHNLRVNPKPSADFGPSSLLTCFQPVDVTFTNLSEGADDYSWNFGNGVLSKDTNPVVSYSEYGDYNISMIATNMYFCSDTGSMVYHVYHNPVADFRVDTTIGCDPFIVPFINLSEYGQEYQWTFGDQGSSQEREPVFGFEGEGISTVGLKVVGLGGCSDSIVKTDYITTNPSPVADFQYSRVNEIDTVQFHNFSSGAISWLWDFGDGNSSLEENPWHRYRYYGMYNISLTAINEYNCKNTRLDSINFELFKGLFVPTAFSPGNTSEEVREFKAIGIGLIKFHLLVYDTWGNLIWETTQLDRGVPSEAWDGTFNGKPLSPDVYVWHLKEAVFKDGKTYDGNRYGSVTLIK
ncbi:MAG: PKD domain-containing protein, partial [Bacteroidales bacterium]|nr:PKD domain-containing protein [Bacteroidales bacterium]